MERSYPAGANLGYFTVVFADSIRLNTNLLTSTYLSSMREQVSGSDRGNCVANHCGRQAAVLILSGRLRRVDVIETRNAKARAGDILGSVLPKLASITKSSLRIQAGVAQSSNFLVSYYLV